MNYKDGRAALSPTSGASQTPPPTSAEDLAQTIRLLEERYSDICLKQRDAVADLMVDAKKEDPPPLWQDLLVAAGEIALAGALGGIGGIVAAKVVKSVAGATGKIIADAVKDSTKKFADKAVKGSISAIAGETGDSTEAFYRGQRDTLTDAAREQRDAFIRQEYLLQRSPDGAKQAHGLLDALDASLTEAYGVQRQETLQQWCIYLSKQSLGVAKNGAGAAIGTDLSKQVGDTSAKGVLGIEMKVGSPGSAPEIVRAEIEGLNEGLRKKLESKPLKDLRIAMTVKGDVGPELSWAEKYLEHKIQPRIYTGRNEQGVVWVDKMRSNVGWLYTRAHPNPEMWGTDPASRARQRQQAESAAFDGARLLVEKDMANLSVKGKLGG